MMRSIVKASLFAWLVGWASMSPVTVAASSDGVTVCPQDNCEAELAKLERYAIKGSGDAAAVVALAYASGDGVAKDAAKARSFIKRGANRRNPMAMFVLADWYRRGFVVERDKALANLWLDRSVAAGYAPAQYEKALSLLASADPQRQQSAIPLLEKAAASNLWTAMYALARLHQTGTLVKKDLPKAGELYAQLARSGHDKAAEQLRVVNRQLAPTDFGRSDHAERLRAAEQAVERITVTADASLYRTRIGRLLDQLETAPQFDNRSIGSRIQGVGCDDTGSPCAVLRPGRGQSSISDVVSNSQGN